MAPKEFVARVDALLSDRFVRHKFRVAKKKVYPGMGATVEVQFASLRARLSVEYGTDFLVQVTAAAEGKWHYLPEVILVLDGLPYTSESGGGCGDFVCVEHLCDRLEQDMDRIAALFDKAHVEETERKLAAIRQQAIQPLLELAEQNRRSRSE